jgi:O-antigen ligase
MAVVAFLGLFLNDKGASKALRIAYLVGFAYVSFTLFINDTFGAYLAAFGGSVFAYVMFLLRTKRDRKPTPLDFAPVMLVAVVLIVAAASLAFSKDGMGIAIRNIQKNVMGFATDIHNVAENNEDAAKAGSTRMTLWKDTVQRITERPVFGFGPMGLYNNEHSITNGDAPHNEFLQIAAYLGIPGLLMYLCGVFSLAWRQLKNLHRLSPMVVVTVGVTATYLMSSAFGNPVFNSAPYFWLFFGLSTAMNEEEPSLLCPLSVDEKAAQEDGLQDVAA